MQPPTAERPLLHDVEHVDVLIVGAGVSGIGAGRYLTTQLPEKSFVILEGRSASGGTWDLFRYPGIRSDSDLTTFGYEFKPWREKESIADASQILAYVRETATENGLDEHIRYQRKVLSAAWTSETSQWLVEVEETDTGRQTYFNAGWIFGAGGYYSYEAGFTPHFEGRDRFPGQVVHPQHWPEDLDCTGKKVVVVGSGATAVTLVPALANDAAHVTMLQRTPTYVMPVPRVDKLANDLRRWFGDDLGHALARQKNIAKQRAIWLFAQRFPTKARQVIRRFNAERLPEGFPVDEHFNPPYNPWDQRLCAVPDGDLFRTIREGDASIVTDRITSFTEAGLQLQSGRELEADIIVTATGLNIQLLGGIELSVDGRPVAVPDTVVYRGVMLSGVPNFAMAVGYTNSSWTLKVGLLCEYFCRLLAHMDARGYDAAWAVVDPDMETRPLLDFGAGYVQRSLDIMPKQGVKAPWTMTMNYYDDVKTLRRGPVVDEHLTFASTPSPDGTASGPETASPAGTATRSATRNPVPSEATA